jgi:hypothetical protein
MPRTPEHVQDTWITDRIRNQYGAGEGTTFPPRMQQGIRIPLANNFKVIRRDEFLGGVLATLSWSIPASNARLPIDSFLISLKGVLSGTAEVNMTPVTARVSPCVIRILSSIETVATVSIQTVLTNGQCSSIELSPTVSIKTIAPEIVASDLGPDTSRLIVGGGTPIVNKTAAYTPTVLDYTINCTANSFTVTLPDSVGLSGKMYVIKNSGTGIITINTTSSQTIDGSLSVTISATEALQVQSDDANWIII